MPTVQEIKTTITGKNEVFKMIALARATEYPILLVGEPGVGKTNICTDYFASCTGENFTLEVNADSTGREITGIIDIASIVEDKKVKYVTRVPSSENILINEIDKATGDFRTALMSLMNEKVLFRGDTTIPCDWKLFVATCNEIPDSPEEKAMLDRFIIKLPVTSLSAKRLISLCQEIDENGSLKERTIKLNIPDEEDLAKVRIPDNIHVALVQVLRSESITDRTIIKAIKMIKCITYIWNCDVEKAVVKAVHIIAGAKASSSISEKIFSRAAKDIIQDIDSLSIGGYGPDELEILINKIETKLQTAVQNKTITDYEYQHLVGRLDLDEGNKSAGEDDE